MVTTMYLGTMTWCASQPDRNNTDGTDAAEQDINDLSCQPLALDGVPAIHVGKQTARKQTARYARHRSTPSRHSELLRCQTLDSAHWALFYGWPARLDDIADLKWTKWA